jgi:signal transduction histidine kinase
MVETPSTAALTTTPGSGEFTVVGDESRVRQLFENLFRNAIEHAGEDVTVTVGVLDNGDGFYIADDGPGIPDEDRDRVFDSGYTTIEDGSGLGLVTVQRIVDAHNWSVTVTDSNDGGARFEIKVGP